MKIENKKKGQLFHFFFFEFQLIWERGCVVIKSIQKRRRIK